MRIYPTLAAGCVVAMGWIAPAAHADNRWYISGSIGGFFLQNYTDETTFSKLVSVPVSRSAASISGNNVVVVARPPTFILTPVTAKGTQRFSYSPGPVENLAIGYRIIPQVRVEGEIGYSNFGVSTLQPSVNNLYFLNLNGRTFDRQSGAAVDRMTWTLNAFYDFPTVASRFSPYLGVGYGGNENHRTTGHFVSTNGTTFTSNGGWSGGNEGLLEAGINIRMSRHWALLPAYRYDHFFIDGQNVNIAKLGMRYSF